MLMFTFSSNLKLIGLLIPLIFHIQPDYPLLSHMPLMTFKNSLDRTQQNNRQLENEARLTLSSMQHI